MWLWRPENSRKCDAQLPSKESRTPARSSGTQPKRWNPRRAAQSSAPRSSEMPRTRGLCRRKPEQQGKKYRGHMWFPSETMWDFQR